MKIYYINTHKRDIIQGQSLHSTISSFSNVYEIKCVSVSKRGSQIKSGNQAKLTRQVIYVQHNTEAQSCNYCCCGKVMSITQPE
jgi:hypothetical protein